MAIASWGTPLPRNEGIVPPIEVVDIRYRNGVITRGVRARERRWSLDEPEFPRNGDWDIVQWQAAEGAEKQ